MGPARLVVSALAVGALTFAAPSVDAQPASLTPLQTAVACAPPAALTPAASRALRVVGSQDTQHRSLFTERDLLVIGGGTGAGLQPGQEFYVRRAVTFSAVNSTGAAVTAGWIKIVGVNQTTAIAQIEHVCGPILEADYLEPFVPPALPEAVERSVQRSANSGAGGALDFANPARVLAGIEDRRTAAPGDFALIDRGAAQGLTPGARMAIYRDLVGTPLPLAALGEAIVVSTAPGTALVRITSAKDAIESGDYLVLRK